MTKERDIHIDMLRCIGLFLVILAHIPINEMVKSVRSFDVMLLVFIAGVSFVKSGRNTKDFNYKRYLQGRVKRLCVPTWITLFIIFTLAAVLCAIVHREYIYSIRQVLESIFFIGGMNGGIGNVWIVRIYMLMAIMAPVFIWMDRKIFNNWAMVGILVGFLIINEIIVNIFYAKDTFVGAIIENIVSSLLCYSVGFFSGIKIAEEKDYSFLKIEMLLLLPIFIVVQIVLCIFGIGFSPNSYKYPPQLYYALYGIIGSLLLYIVCNRISIKNSKLKIVIIWISKKSFDIYLAHTLVLKLLSWGDDYITNIYIFKVGIFYYLFVLIASVILIYIKDVFIGGVERVRK